MKITTAGRFKEPIEWEDSEGRLWTLRPTLKGADAVRMMQNSNLVEDARSGGDTLTWLASLLMKALRRHHPEFDSPEKVLAEFELGEILEVTTGFLAAQLGRTVSSVRQMTATNGTEESTRTDTTSEPVTSGP